jgi:hypothetical protein
MGFRDDPVGDLRGPLHHAFVLPWRFARKMVASGGGIQWAKWRPRRRRHGEGLFLAVAVEVEE